MTCPPVLLVFFRRPTETAQVFAAIRQARPSRLYLAADGPRPDRDDAPACEAARKVVEAVDWPCEVKRLYRDKNVGLRQAVPEAISWFLADAGEGIILEDDCVPSPEFFGFAERMLDRYRDDLRVMHINGSNFHQGRRWTTNQYYFSRYNHAWGWATWNRAWKHFDLEMAGLEGFLRTARDLRFWDSSREQTYWTKIFRWTKSRRVVTWDYQWNLAQWSQGGLCITPEANMITNIGFGDQATNTVVMNRPADLMYHGSLAEGPEPDLVIRHAPADRANFLKMFWGSPWVRFLARVHQARGLLGHRR